VFSVFGQRKQAQVVQGCLQNRPRMALSSQFGGARIAPFVMIADQTGKSMQQLALRMDEQFEPYFAHPQGFTLYEGDSLEILERMEPEQFDVIFADPPYFLSNGGITCQNGRMVSVDKGRWDRSEGVAANHEFN